MPLELTDLVAERPVRPRRKRRGRSKALVAGGVLAGLALIVGISLALVGAGEAAPAGPGAKAAGFQAPRAAPVLDDGATAGDVESAARSGRRRCPDDAAPAVPEEPRHILPADEKAILAAYPRESRLEGLEMLASGDVDAAGDWIRNYLAAPSDGRDDQAMLALAVVYMTKGETPSAESTLSNLVRQRPDSNRSGDGYYLLGKIRAGEGRLDEAERAFLEAVRVYEKSHGGRRSAKRLADELYRKHVEDYPKRTEWERIRDLYSIAIRGLVSRGPLSRRPPGLPADWDRAGIISRLDRLNDWIIFTTHARPKEGYPTNVEFHGVARGDTLSGIAKRYGVTVGSIKRLNGIPSGSHVIRPGQELKILRGRTEICIDTHGLVMTVWIDKKFFREYPVGIGREGRTPIGRFRIANRLRDPDWWQGGRLIPFGDPRNILGTRWLGFERVGAGRGIGVHGSRLEDGAWEGVGERASNGCIRMRNPDVEELFDFVPLGTEVVICE